MIRVFPTEISPDQPFSKLGRNDCCCYQKEGLQWIFHRCLRCAEMAEAKDTSETKQELSLVCQSNIIFPDPGDDVVLSCHLEPAVSAASMEIQWWNNEDLVCHYKDGWVKVSYEGRVSLLLQDLHNGNVSLIIKDVRRSQKGHYICEVIHKCQTLQENVFLHICSEDFSLVIPNGTVSADPGEDIILPIHLSPETSAVSMNIRWFRESELIYQYKNGQEKTNDNYEHRLSLSIQELKRGNLSLTLRNFEPSDSGKYTCKVFHDGCLQTGVVHLQEIQKCDGARLRRVLSRVKKDILIQKVELLNGSLKLVEETLSQNESIKNVFDPTSKRSNSMEGIPPALEKESLSNSYGNIIHITTRSSPRTSRRHCDQNTEEGNTATKQELRPNMQKRNLPEEITESIIVHRKGSTQAQANPGAMIQSTQEWSNATEQEGSSLAIQSRVQERGKTSQSVTSLAVDTTQTSERPEDRNSKERTPRKNCQIM